MASLPRLPAGWPAVLDAKTLPALAGVLQGYAQTRRWFRAKNRGAQTARIVELLSLTDEPLTRASDVLVILELSFAAGTPELYVIPLTHVDESRAAAIASESPHGLVARLEGSGGSEPASPPGVLVDGLVTGSAATWLARLARNGGERAGEGGRLRGHPEPAFTHLPEESLNAPQLSKGEQTNSTVSFGEKVLLKIYRQLTPVPNPELEIGLFLDATIGTKANGQRRPPPVLGALTYEAVDGTVHSVGIAHQYVANQGDAWSLVQRELQDYFARTADQAATSPPAVGRFAELAETLGRRTGELHLALAKSDGGDPAFAVEPLTSEDRVQAAARARAMLEEHLTALQARLDRLSPEARRSAETLLAPDSGERRGIQALLERFGKESLEVVKTRIHGDLHLGQVLFHGDDFTIIDFEGEPARPLVERRAKSSPLRDVMGMVRSFSYAPEAVLRKDTGAAATARRQSLLAAAAQWETQVRAAFLRGYQATVGNAPFLPPPTDPGKLELMLAFYELERVIYEVGYELNNRTDWADIPLGGLQKVAARMAQAGDRAGGKA